MATMRTAEEVAQRLNVTKKWVYRHADELGGIRLGRLLRFQDEGVDAYLARVRHAQPQPTLAPQQRTPHVYRVEL